MKIKTETKDYQVRKINADTYKKLQHMAVDEGLSLNKLIIKILDKTVAETLRPVRMGRL